MRVALIILSTVALIFIMSIIILAAQKYGINSDSLGKNIFPPKISTDNALAIESLKSQIRMEEKLKENEAKLSELQKKLDLLTGKNPPLENGDENTLSGETQTGSIVPVSAKFLAKVVSAIELTHTPQNEGIFNLHTFDTTNYSTYTDDKFGITVIASLVSYDTFLKNFQALDSSVYSVNETTIFPFKSFYVNPPKKDTLVRIVFAVEKQTLLISLPKTKFETFKNLILKKPTK